MICQLNSPFLILRSARKLSFEGVLRAVGYLRVRASDFNGSDCVQNRTNYLRLMWENFEKQKRLKTETPSKLAK